MHFDTASRDILNYAMSEESQSSDIEELLKLDEIAQRKRDYFKALLDEQRDKSGHLLAHKAEMGDTLSFISTVTLGWAAQHVGLAKELPIWENKTDEDGRIKIDEETLEELRQREPDWRRQLTMVRYLALKNHHKFPPILVAAWQDWVGNPKSEKWDNKIATANSINVTELDSKGTYMDLDYEETGFFALDGQHRIMAIRGLQELLRDGRLPGKKANGQEVRGRSISTDSLVAELDKHSPDPEHTGKARLQSLLDESIGIEIIPSVFMGDTYESALRRLRSIFVHVNRTAKPLAKGTLAQLDEDDGYAIVARRVMLLHKLLRNKRVKMDKENLTATSFEYTTLVTLTKVAQEYLIEFKSDWESLEKGDLPFRPHDDDLDRAVEIMLEYFDQLSRLPSHQHLIEQIDLSCAVYRKDDENENIFFWPIAQMAYAEATGYLTYEKGISLSDITDKVFNAEKGPDKDKKLRLKIPKSIWFGVLCDVVDKRMRRTKQYQDLCTRLLIYLLGGVMAAEERKALLEEYRLARRTSDGKCIGLEGDPVEPNELTLPPLWD